MNRVSKSRCPTSKGASALTSLVRLVSLSFRIRVKQFGTNKEQDGDSAQAHEKAEHGGPGQPLVIGIGDRDETKGMLSRGEYSINPACILA